MPSRPCRPLPHRPLGRPLLATAAVGAAVLALAGCGSVVVRTGDPVSQDRDVSAVTAVTLATAGRLTLGVGATPSLTITAADGVIDRLTSDVEDGRLVLDLPGRLVNVGAIEYDLVVPTLEGIRVEGAGRVDGEVATTGTFELRVDGAAEVDLAGLDVDELSVDIAGVGAVSLAGGADRQEVRLDGAGRYRGEGLVSQEAVVTISGTGAATVDVARTLTAEISGAGEITYSGDPDVTTRLDGVGRVRRG